GEIVHRLEQLAVVDRSQTAEVEQQRDPLAVEKDARVARAGAPDDDEPSVERRARDPGQVLYDLQRVTGGPGDALDLLERDGRLADLLLLAHTSNHGLVGGVEGAEQVVDGPGLPSRIDALGGLEALELAGGDGRLHAGGGTRTAGGRR